jgi:hypothetical protein
MVAARELRGRPCRRYGCSPPGARVALRRGACAALTMDPAPPSVADLATPSAADLVTPSPSSPWISHCPPSQIPCRPRHKSRAALGRRSRDALAAVAMDLALPSISEPAPTSPRSPRLQVPSGESMGRATLTCVPPGLAPPSVAEPAKNYHICATIDRVHVVTLMVDTRASSGSPSRCEVLLYNLQRAEYLSSN